MYTLFSKLILACSMMDYFIKSKTLKPTFKTTVFVCLKAFAVLELCLFCHLLNRCKINTWSPQQELLRSELGPQSLLGVKVAKSIFAPEF